MILLQRWQNFLNTQEFNHRLLRILQIAEWRCLCSYLSYKYPKGHPVAQLVEALRNKPEGRGFDSRWCHCNFSLIYSFRPHCGPGVDSASNRNEYQEYFLGGKGGRCVMLTTLPPSCCNCLEIWEPQHPGNLRACPALYRACLTCMKIVNPVDAYL